MDSSHLIMSDNLSHNNTLNSWTYNHGRRPGTTNDLSTVPGITGLNELYGDGRVIWKSVNQFNLAAWTPGTHSIPVVPAAGADATFY